MGLLSFITGGDGAYNTAISDLSKNKSLETSYFQKKANDDYMNRSENQAALRAARQLLEEGTQRAVNRGVVSGATDESVALQKSANNQAMENIVSGIAADSSNKKDQAMQGYLEANRQYSQAINNLRLQKDQQESAALGGLLKSGIGVAGNIIDWWSGRGAVTSQITKNLG